LLHVVSSSDRLFSAFIDCLIISTTPEAERSDGENRDALIRGLRSVVGERYVLIEKEDVIVHEQDGSIFQVMPEIVVVSENVVGYGIARKMRSS